MPSSCQCGHASDACYFLRQCCEFRSPRTPVSSVNSMPARWRKAPLHSRQTRLGSFLQKRRRWLSSPLLRRLSKANTCSAPFSLMNSTPGNSKGDSKRLRSGLENWVRFAKNGGAGSHRFCFGGFRRRTPGPPPFSSMNSTPAASKARRTARSFAAVMDVSPSVSSARRIVATLSDERPARSSALQRMSERAALIWALVRGWLILTCFSAYAIFHSISDISYHRSMV